MTTTLRRSEKDRVTNLRIRMRRFSVWRWYGQWTASEPERLTFDRGTTVLREEIN
jgi:hypothetical protein